MIVSLTTEARQNKQGFRESHLNIVVVHIITVCIFVLQWTIFTQYLKRSHCLDQDTIYWNNCGYNNLSLMWDLSRGSLFGIMRLCRRMPHNDLEGQIFLFAPNIHDGFFFLHTIRILSLDMFWCFNALLSDITYWSHCDFANVVMTST